MVETAAPAKEETNGCGSFTYIPSKAIESFGPTVFAEFGVLAKKHNAVNLAQGAPDFNCPDFVMKAGVDCLTGGPSFSQYARAAGQVSLVNTLAKLYGPQLNREINPMDEVLITVGASEAIFACVQAIIGTGDECIMIEPVFDPIKAAVIMCGGVPKYVSLKTTVQDPTLEKFHSDDLVVDLNELESLFSDKTKLIIVNSPHNPTGKVFSRQELEDIAAIVRKHPRVAVISDEVYEYLTFDDAEHTKFASLPGMWGRTLTLGSASKTFSITGWRVGWAIGPKDMIQGALYVHQYVPFATVTATQEAVARAFEEAPSHDYYNSLKEMFQAKRDHLVQSLIDVGLKPFVPKGTYFVVADITSIKLGPEYLEDDKHIKIPGGNRMDWKICRYLTSHIGVAALPMSAFYSEQHAHIGERYARFAFCKTDHILDAARTKLQALIKH